LTKQSKKVYNLISTQPGR